MQSQQNNLDNSTKTKPLSMKIKTNNLKEASTIELFTTDGKMLFQNKAELKNGLIPMPDLSKGTYLLRVKNKNSICTSRFSKR